MKGLNPLKKYTTKELNLYPDIKMTLNTEGVYTGEYLMTVGFNPGITDRRSSVILEINEVKKRYKMEKVNIQDKLSLFSDYWNPRIVGELNNQHVKLVKFQGEFVWHKHDHEDELFYVVEGEFNMELRDKTFTLHQGEFLIVPRGVEHRPVAEKEVSIMLFEPNTTLNTGDASSKLTRSELERI